MGVSTNPVINHRTGQYELQVPATIKKFILEFFMGDSSIEIRIQKGKAHANIDNWLLLKKNRLPRNWEEVQGGANPVYYEPSDLRVGTVVDIYSRKFLLIDCDSNTHEHYQSQGTSQGSLKLVTVEKNIVHDVPNPASPPLKYRNLYYCISMTNTDSRPRRFGTLALGTLALVGAVLLGLSARKQPALTPAELLKQLAERPEDVSIVAYGVRPDGAPDPAQPSVLVRPDAPMPLASSRKIVLLAAYAQAVSEGRLDPAQVVKLADWEAYYLPRTDGGAHPAALGRLGLKAGGSATLDQVARAMIQESDNAAADVMYMRVGADAVQAVIHSAGLKGQEPLFPISGEFWAYDRTRLFTTLKLSREAFRTEALRLTPVPGSRPAAPPLPGVAEQARLTDAFTVRGTARDYASIMARVMTGTFLNRDISAIMARHLEWPLESAEVKNNFERLGAKGGSLPGIYTNNLFLLPKVGPAAGQRRVVSVFLRRIPENRYGAWTRAAELFAVTAAVRPDFAATVNTALGGTTIGR